MTMFVKKTNVRKYINSQGKKITKSKLESVVDELERYVKEYLDILVMDGKGKVIR